VSSESSSAVRLARHSQNAWARHVERVESSRNEPSGIWALRFPLRHRKVTHAAFAPSDYYCAVK